MEHIHNTSTDPCEKSKMFFFLFVSPIIKNVVLFPSRSRYAVKLISCITFESASSAYCLLKSFSIILL